MKIRKGDTVFIRTGEDRGKKGKVLFLEKLTLAEKQLKGIKLPEIKK